MATLPARNWGGSINTQVSTHETGTAVTAASPGLARKLLSWFDSSTLEASNYVADDDKSVERVDWARILPFVVMHIVCLSVIWVGWSPIAVAMAVVFYVLRMFAITGFYHRYFSHRSFKTSRVAQFIFGLLG